ncbi:MAG TPA: hypothetical protein DEA97_14380 [Bacteroidales bacterium]|nr:hypothetical protein [Bacteroidales bacterium]
MNNLKGLIVYSITMMLERMSFYAMMSILILSFMEQRGNSGDEAGYNYAVFYFSIYVSMLIMGLVGDIVNRRKIIIAGLLIMAIGYILYFMMSKESEISLIISGVFIVLGLGAFYTNLQVQVGDLYKNSFKNGAMGYLIFYMFINVGALIAPYASIYIKKEFGVEAVFLFCGCATFLALALYYLVPVSMETEDEFRNKQRKAVTDDIIDVPDIVPIKENPVNTGYGTDKITGLIFLALLVPFLWSAFHQTGLIFTFYMRDFIEMNGQSAEVVQSYNPVLIVLFSLIGVALMYFFVKMKKIHSIFLFIGTGIIIVAAGYSIPAYGLANITDKLSYSYAIIPMVLFSLGELFITPFIFLGYYHFSPARVRGLFMGLFIILSAAGNQLLFLYAADYEVFGAPYAFNKIVIHILICAAAVFLVWYLVKRLGSRRKNLEGGN